MILWAVQEDSRPDDHDGYATGNTIGEELALNATIPVMIFRADMGSPISSLLRPDRILVPLDDSNTSGLALPIADKLARLYNVPIHLVTVIDPITALPPAYAYLPSVDLDRHDALEALHGDANQLLNRAEIYLQRLGRRVTSELVTGSTGRCLLGAIRKGDLVVMTTHGKGNASKSRFGSMALRVVRSSPVPVVVLHPGAVGVYDNRDHSQWGKKALLDSHIAPSINAAR
jgi:nucleotide-binding universal stress UspA family protein